MNGHIKRKTIKKIAKWSVATLAIAFLITFAAYHYDEPEVNASTVVQEDEIDLEAVIGEALDAKIRTLENDVLDQLASCETGGVEEPDGFVRLDTNDLLSWGPFQWQRYSVQHWVKVLYGIEIDLKTAGLIAFDAYPTIPLRELTRRVIFEVEDGVFEWYNCAKKLNLYSQVTLINKLR